jgi:hypothetical protein
VQLEAGQKGQPLQPLRVCGESRLDLGEGHRPQAPADGRQFDALAAKLVDETQPGEVLGTVARRRPAKFGRR